VLEGLFIRKQSSNSYIIITHSSILVSEGCKVEIGRWQVINQGSEYFSGGSFETTIEELRDRKVKGKKHCNN